MVKEEKVFYTFKKNMPYYNVGVRRHRHDTVGLILTNEFPTVRIEEEDLREFKMANKYGLQNGLIIQVDEEDLEWELNNAISDEQVDELLKNYAKLKSTLQTITAPPVLHKILRTAQDQEKSKKTISLIQARVDEVVPDEDSFIYREDMQATYDDTRLGD